MKERKIVIFSSIVPPEPSGSGLRAWRHAKYINEQEELFCLATKTQERLANLNGVNLVRICRAFNMTGRCNVRYGRVGTVLRECLDLLCEPIAWITFFAVNRRRFSLIHVFGVGRDALWCTVIGMLFRKKTVVEYTVVPVDALKKRRGVLPTPGSLVRFVAARIANCLVAISPVIQEHCYRQGVPENRVALIPNGTDTNRFRKVEIDEKDVIRSSLGLNRSDLVFLAVGGFTMRKGIDITLKTFLRIQKVYDNARILFIGSHDHPAHIKNKVEVYEPLLSEGLDSSRISFIGRVSNIERYMHATDFLLVPSRREGFPNVIIEAMACGVCVVARRIRGLTDYIITDGKDGILVESEDPEDYFEAIKTQVTNPGWKNEIGRAAIGTVRRRFREEEIYKEYLTLYHELLID